MADSTIIPTENHAESSDSNSNGENHSGISVPNASAVMIASLKAPEILEEYGPNLKLLDCNSQVAELLTIIRDK